VCAFKNTKNLVISECACVQISFEIIVEIFTTLFCMTCFFPECYCLFENKPLPPSLFPKFANNPVDGVLSELVPKRPEPDAGAAPADVLLLAKREGPPNIEPPAGLFSVGTDVIPPSPPNAEVEVLLSSEPVFKKELEALENKPPSPEAAGFCSFLGDEFTSGLEALLVNWPNNPAGLGDSCFCSGSLGLLLLLKNDDLGCSSDFSTFEFSFLTPRLPLNKEEPEPKVLIGFAAPPKREPEGVSDFLESSFLSSVLMLAKPLKVEGGLI